MANSKGRFALIDADSILYAVALGSELKSPKTGIDGEDEFFQVKDVGECYREVVSRLEAVTQEVRAEDALICLTPPGKSYRYALLPSYKANRKAIRRPEVLVPLQAMVAERKPFRVLAVRGLEADDICGISSTSLQKAKVREPIIVSIDKDMLQIPGLNYSWLTAARTQTVGVVHEVSGFEADRMHLYQTLIGDVVDNYTGCPGVGPKKAMRLLESCVASQGELDWRWIVEAFRKKGFSEEYALTQARVARILRDTDWDHERKEVTLWMPPQEYVSAASNLGESQKPIATAPATPSPTSTRTVPTRAILSDRKGATLH